jgi:hypothetical protein
MTRARIFLAYTLLVLLTASIANSQPSPAISNEKLDRLIVYGKDFVFGVREPSTWTADTEELAKQFRVNVVFVPKTADGDDRTVTIRVRVNKKIDENTIEDLNYDMAQYRNEFPNAQFNALDEAHPEYKTFAKVVYVPDKFYEYVAYVNPGPDSKFTFSVALSRRGTPATAEQMSAFDEVLRSLLWLPAAPQN